jgi:hypothetical protein
VAYSVVVRPKVFVCFFLPEGFDKSWVNIKVPKLNMTKETWVDLWKYEGKLFVWTIEHIFPQGDNIPASWVTMIAGGDERKAKAIQETHVHKLGVCRHWSNAVPPNINVTSGARCFSLAPEYLM